MKSGFEPTQTLQEASLEILDKHKARSVRAFLLRPGEAEQAFWDIIYAKHHRVSHRTAKKVASHLERSQKRVRDVIKGWVPDILADTRSD